MTPKLSKPFSKEIALTRRIVRRLNFVVHGLLATGADVPERLQNWDTEREKVTGKWTRENARNYLIGSVVEAMETGRGYFVRRDPDVVQLKSDLKRVCAKAGNPPNGLPTKSHRYGPERDEGSTVEQME